MAKPSFLRRKDKSIDATEAVDDSGPVQQARARARQRLIGAVILLAIGVIVFPILFETQPRPIAPDIPIQVARKDSGTVIVAPAPKPLPPPPAPPADAGVEQPAAGASAAIAATPPPVVAEPKPAEAKPEPKAEPKPEPKPMPKPPEAKPEVKAVAAESKPATSAASTPASAPRSGRYVVQVGAFTDAVAVREARQKVEKLGLTTYTQVIETDSGRRTRVRVGPFETREQADKAGAKLKAAGLPAYILVL